MSDDIKRDVIGGQAVIEGVMMINKDKIGIAVRAPDDKIKLKKDKVPKIPKILQLPFIRGVVKLFVMLVVGLKALNYSSDIAMSEEDGDDIKGWQIFVMIATSFIIAIALFKFLPLFVANFVDSRFSTNYIMFNIIDGILKIAIFILYVYLISFMKDVKRLYQYHGAEHKTVYCHEKNLPLTYKNVKKFSPLHPRCGTSFIMIVLIFSIIVYTFIPQDTSLLAKLGYRVLLLPVIAGISYEFLRLSAKFVQNPLVKIFILPGLLLQRITTSEPDKKQIEIAIKAMKSVI